MWSRLSADARLGSPHTGADAAPAVTRARDSGKPRKAFITQRLSPILKYTTDFIISKPTKERRHLYPERLTKISTSSCVSIPPTWIST